MNESFGNQSPQVCEFIDMPERIRVLADAIIDLQGVENFTSPETIKDTEWYDSQTRTSIQIQRKYEDNKTFYFIDVFDDLDDEDDIEPFKRFYMDSSQKYEVRRIDTNYQYIEPAEGDEEPEDELYDILVNGPIDDAAAILNNHEQANIDDRFQLLVGSYALSDYHTTRMINRAFEMDAKKQKAALADIVDRMSLYTGLRPDDAHRAIKIYWDGKYHSERIHRPVK